MLTVFIHCWLTGVLGDMIETNAKFSTGHVKIVSRSYANNIDQMPIDLALDNADSLMTNLENQYPDIEWVGRIRFGGLLDAPDAQGETKAQGPAMAWAVDLLSKESREPERLNITRSLVRGEMPSQSGEILLSDAFAQKLKVTPGDTVTLIGSTMYGGMAIHNFTVSGTVTFGITAMDRGTMIVNLDDARYALNMSDAVSEILGYFPGKIYDPSKANKMQGTLNAKFSDRDDKLSPTMLKLTDQNQLASMLDYIGSITDIFIFVFIAIMAIVLWNTGLIGGLRRYGEIGVRLAIGEEKGHIYRSMIYESLLTGIIGAVAGTAIGLTLGYILQIHGIDFGDLMKNATIMTPTTYRAKVTAEAWYIGFVPGIVAPVIGTMLSGIGIYKRKTAQLFKELET